MNDTKISTEAQVLFVTFLSPTTHHLDNEREREREGTPHWGGERCSKSFLPLRVVVRGSSASTAHHEWGWGHLYDLPVHVVLTNAGPRVPYHLRRTDVIRQANHRDTATWSGAGGRGGDDGGQHGLRRAVDGYRRPEEAEKSRGGGGGRGRWTNAALMGRRAATMAAASLAGKSSRRSGCKKSDWPKRMNRNAIAVARAACRVMRARRIHQPTSPP